MEVGDTLRFANFEFLMEVNKNSTWKEAGSEIEWYVPCASLDFINSNYKKESCEISSSKEQMISSNYLLVQDAVNEIASLIAQSKADPLKRDTLKILISKKVE